MALTSSQRGFSILATTLCGETLFSILGLAVDYGRVYIIRNEAQGYADAAAISAALRLDGTAAGLRSADSAVAASPNKWNFATHDFTGTLLEFSADGSAGWSTSASADASRMKYARVTASVDEMPLLLRPASRAAVKAVAVAGKYRSGGVRLTQ